MAADPSEAVRRCLELQPIFVRAPGGITVTRQDEGPERPFAVRIDWRAGHDEPAGFYICFFLPRTRTADQWQIAQVQSSRFGMMSRDDVQQAYKMLRAMAYPATPPAPPPGPLVRLLHALQLAIDALGLGAVYALLAIPFTFVFGVTRVLSLAFGEVHTAGAYLFAIARAGGLAEVLRLAQGARTRYLLVSRENGWPVIQGLGFDVGLSRGHL